MDRHSLRENSIVCIYQNLLVNKSINETILDVFESVEIDGFAQMLIDKSITNKERYIGYINNVMSEYSFDRLGYIEQALLLMGCSEFDAQTAPASVIIDEYILLAKKYCDDDAYKLINSVLDRI